MTSPFLTSSEAAVYLRFQTATGDPDRKRLRQYLTRHGVKLYKRGRSVLVHRDDLMATLEPVPARRSA